MKKKIGYVFLTALLVGVFAATEAPAIESEFHGQFRINSYFQESSDGDTIIGGSPAEADDAMASRLRFRPTWDVSLDNGVAMHLQLNIGHINSNLSNARYTLNGSSSGDPVVSLRHGYISAPIPFYEAFSLTAGLVPLSDKFGDTLFSSDWDYNPLAFVLNGDVSGIKVRVAHANANEGSEGTSAPEDDIDQWIVDADTEVGLGASYYALNVNSGSSRLGSGNTSANEHYVGVRYNTEVSSLDLGGWAVYNWGERDFSAGEMERSNSGFAVKGEVKADVGRFRVGLMGLYASGDEDFSDSTKDDSDAFITPMSIVGHTGYWGYTGKLNVQGPTDTGIDCQAINIDGADYCSGAGLGSGVTTVQANVSTNLIPDRLDGYAAVGWFQNNDVPASQEDAIGTDIYAQLKYHFSPNMALEAGIDYVLLGEGHPDNLEGGTTTESRDIMLLFSRLQLEY